MPVGVTLPVPSMCRGSSAWAPRACRGCCSWCSRCSSRAASSRASSPEIDGFFRRGERPVGVLAALRTLDAEAEEMVGWVSERRVPEVVGIGMNYRSAFPGRCRSAKIVVVIKAQQESYLEHFT